MILVGLLVGVMCLAAVVVFFVFYLLSKETVKDHGVKAVPIVNPNEILGNAASHVDEESYKVRIDELQGELQAISQKGAEQVHDADAVVEQLTQENAALREEQDQRERRLNDELAQAQQQVDQLRQANSALQTQLEASEIKLRQVQDEGIALRNQMDDELSQSEAVIQEFKRIAPRTEDSLKEMEELKSQIETLKQDVHDLHMTNIKLKEFNQHLIEKSEALQYELVKHRAQASGLERICENYKLQLEKR